MFLSLFTVTKKIKEIVIYLNPSTLPPKIPKTPTPQPPLSAFQMFDDLLLLGKSGQVVYQGPLSAAETYFARIGFPLPTGPCNPADFYIDVTIGGETSLTTVVFQGFFSILFSSVHCQSTSNK